MEAGAEIAKEILQELDYPIEKAKKVIYYVSVHDNWAFGENDLYKNDPILGAFQDLDFMWMATPKGFPALMKIRNLNPEDMLKYIETSDKLSLRPLSTTTTKNLYNAYIHARREEIKNIIYSEVALR